MSEPEPVLQQWADQYAREKRGLGAVFGEGRKHALAPDAARELAQEAIQEAVARILQAYGQRPEHYTGGYRHFCCSVTRTAINVAREQLRRRWPGNLAEGAEPLFVTPDPRLEAVRICLDQLPQRHRELLQLRGEEDCTLDEMADRLLPLDGCSPNARRLRIRREYRAALAALCEALRQGYPDLDWEDTPSQMDDL
jgi:DNA-directed RNA polymerase specialized sigma24 family protein